LFKPAIININRLQGKSLTMALNLKSLYPRRQQLT